MVVADATSRIEQMSRMISLLFFLLSAEFVFAENPSESSTSSSPDRMNIVFDRRRRSWLERFGLPRKPLLQNTQYRLPGQSWLAIYGCLCGLCRLLADPCSDNDGQVSGSIAPDRLVAGRTVGSKVETQGRPLCQGAASRGTDSG